MTLTHVDLSEAARGMEPEVTEKKAGIKHVKASIKTNSVDLQQRRGRR